MKMQENKKTIELVQTKFFTKSKLLWIELTLAIGSVPDGIDCSEYLDDGLDLVRGVDNVLALQALLVQAGRVDIHVVLDQLLGLLDLHVVLQAVLAHSKRSREADHALGEEWAQFGQVAVVGETRGLDGRRRVRRLHRIELAGAQNLQRVGQVALL